MLVLQQQIAFMSYTKRIHNSKVIWSQNPVLNVAFKYFKNTSHTQIWYGKFN